MRLKFAKRVFTEAECSERIQRALRKQLRPIDDIDDRYETGDKVYFKRVDCTEWKGPGVVIGQDGVVIFMRHGGTYVRVHHSRLQITHKQCWEKGTFSWKRLNIRPHYQNLASMPHEQNPDIMRITMTLKTKVRRRRLQMVRITANTLTHQDSQKEVVMFNLTDHRTTQPQPVKT